MPYRPSAEVEAIVNARHGDPFAFLGMHQELGRSLRPGVSARCRECRGRRKRDRPDRRARRAHPPGRDVRRQHGRPPRDVPLPAAASGGAGTSRNSRTSTASGRCSANSTCICWSRATISPAIRSSARIRSCMRASRASAFAVWAPNAQRVSVVGDFNDWDGRRMPMRRRHAGGIWEIFVPGLRPGHLYKYELIGPDGGLLPLKADPYAEQAEHPPGTASIVAAPSRHVWQDGSWIGERWRRQERDAPISIYEVHLGSWRRNERGRLSDLSRTGRAARAVCRRSRVYPYRGVAGHRVSVRRVLGISADLAVRADLAVWRARRFPRLCRCLPPCRARAAARLGAGPFPDRRARSRAVRRHRALRARRPAAGHAPRLGHADLQLRPPRGIEFPAVERALLAARVSHRRAQGRCRRLDALPRLQPQGRRVDPERLRRAGEPRRDRVSAPDERTGVRRGHRRDDGRRGIDRVADGVAPGLCRRARLRLQMEHGVDARHAQLHVAAIRSIANTTTTT